MECAALGVAVLGFALAGCAEDGTAGRAAMRPLAALSELAQRSPTRILFAEGRDPDAELRSALEDGTRRNCGPPYEVTP